MGKKLEAANYDLLHLEVIDGGLLSIWLLFTKWFKKVKGNTFISLDIHLDISDSGKIYGDIYKIKA